MRIQISINGTDVSDQCLLAQTRITYDSTKRLNTANITVMGQSLALTARWDSAQYDVDEYSLDLAELYVVTIYDGAKKLFEGQIYSLDLAQSDSPDFGVFYTCSLNDKSAALDRSVCWDSTFTLPLPCSDAQIINSLLGHFCPGITLANIATIIPAVQAYDFLSKTCRQILDDVCVLSMGEWSLDPDGNLSYGPAGDAPPAPFALSTSPDNVASFEVKVSSYKQDFSNPINRCYVRGTTDAATGLLIESTYEDPLSVGQYGAYESAIVDTTITNSWDASLRAKSTVIQYAYPVEQGNFTIWKDGLECGQGVHITEDALGIDGVYVIRQLVLNWQDQETVQYDAQFGAAQPDLEMFLRQLAQRTRWASSMTPVGVPLPGSVTDGSIAPPGLSAGSISSVDASAIQGQLQAGQIGSVSATTLVGQITANQIGSVFASSLVGTVSAAQIGSVNASVIQGAIQAGQIGSVSASTITGAIQAGQIASITAGQITGKVSAGQITSIDATQITGSLSATQIGSVNASAITGSLTATQIGSVNASSIVGSISAGQISSITAGQITGTLSSTQIGSVAATSITGSINAGQIGSVSAGSITGVIVSSQLGDQIIDSLSKYSTTLGPVPVFSDVSQLFPVPNKNLPPNSFFYWVPDGNFYQVTPDGLSWNANNNPENTLMQFFAIGKIKAQSIVGVIIASQIGSVNAGSITGQIQASQIGTVDASQITGTITATQIGTVAATQITGTLTAAQISTVNATSITGTLSAAQIGPISATSITGTITASQIQSVTSAQITGELTADQIQSVHASTITGQLNAAQIATVTAGSITGQIQATQIASVNASAIAGGIQATQITSVNATTIQGAITAPQIASVNASAITGTLVATQIGSVNAASITINVIQATQIGSVNASTITTGTLLVGGSGNMIGGVFCYDGTSTLVAAIGNIAAGIWGGWFKMIGIAGTDYTSAKIRSDINGNVFITDANLSITNAATGTTASSSPAAFDGTYSSVAFQVAGASDLAKLVSRGLVVYSGTLTVGAFVRDPGSPNAGVWTIMDASGNYAAMGHGTRQRVWAKAGFGVGGAPDAYTDGLTQTITEVDGSQKVFTGGILTQRNGPTVPLIGTSANAYQVNVAVPNDPNHYYTLWFINGLLASASFNAIS